MIFEMKKFGFFALLAAVLLTACGPKETPVVVNSITLNQTTLTLSLGGDTKLIATTDPVGQEVTWTTSNDKVATVKANGLVQAVAEGEAVITATAGDKTATCKVTVAADAIYDYFDIADYSLFGDFTPVPGVAPYHTKLTNGDSVRCVLKTITVYAWDANVQWVNGTGFVGDGLVCMLGDEVPFWVIEEDYTNSKYNGYYLGEGGVFVYNTKSIEPAFAKPGHIDVETYGDFVQAQYSADLEADFETMQAKTNGALLSLCTADDGFEGWYGLYYAAINRLVVLDGEEEGDPLSVAADVTWCRYTSDDRLYGFAVDLDVYEAEKKIQLVTPYDYATVNKVYDEYELFDRFEAYYGAEGENILATSAKKIGTRYMSKEMPTRNGKALDNKTLHMAR